MSSTKKTKLITPRVLTTEIWQLLVSQHELLCYVKSCLCSIGVTFHTWGCVSMATVSSFLCGLHLQQTIVLPEFKTGSFSAFAFLVLVYATMKTKQMLQKTHLGKTFIEQDVKLYQYMLLELRHSKKKKKESSQCFLSQRKAFKKNNYR